MVEILNLLKERFKTDFNPLLYGYFAIFLLISITYNYTFDFEDSVLDANYGNKETFFKYTIFYWLGYYLIAIPQAFIRRRANLFKVPGFWLKPTFFIILLGYSSYFYFHRSIEFPNYNAFELFYVKKLLYQMKAIFVIIIPVLAYWYFFESKDGRFYGLSLRNVNLKPYFIMLLIMLPLISIASFGADFQDTYPILKPWRLKDVFGWSEYKQMAIFEPLYGLSFFSVELLFRGALIIGVAKLLGRDAILPMVSMYAFLHFGKPLGETIGSIFGGYILGVIALEKRHIFGGCVIHIGVAWLMELTAVLQHYYN